MLDRYPTLSGLREDLERLHAAEEVRSHAQRGRRLRIGAGRDLARVEAPWLGKSYWMSNAQAEVVRQLLHAHISSACPEVDQRVLLRKAGSDCRRLADLFADHPAWGKLILPGSRPGCYRIAPPESEEWVDDVDGA